MLLTNNWEVSIISQNPPSLTIVKKIKAIKIKMTIKACKGAVTGKKGSF